MKSWKKFLAMAAVGIFLMGAGAAHAVKSDVVAEIELSQDMAQVVFDGLDGAVDHGYTLIWDIVPNGSGYLLATINDIDTAADYNCFTNYSDGSAMNLPVMSYVADTGGASGQTAFYFNKGTGKASYRSLGLQIAGDNPAVNVWSDTPVSTVLKTSIANLTKITLKNSSGLAIKAGSRFLLKRNLAATIPQ